MRKKLTDAQRRWKKKQSWDKILNGKRRPGAVRGSVNEWRKAFNLRMQLGMEQIGINSDVILDYFGLKEGYTAQDLKKARKKKIFNVHPDRGGTHQEVLECNELYEELLRRL